jgi:putative drug exporter of the RND superfamily
LATLARWCFRNRRLVLALWLVGLVSITLITRVVGSSYATNFSLPQADSSLALGIVKANFPAQSGDSDQIVIQAKEGTLSDPQVAQQVNALLTKVGRLSFVTSVTSPNASGLVSKNGTIGLATVQLDTQAQNISNAQAQRLISTAQSANGQTLNVQLGGAAIRNGENQGGGSADFFVGVLLALVVLYFAFRRSFLSALLPLLSAMVAIGIGTSFIGLLSHGFSVPQFAIQLSQLIALGVGVDYALFIVNRHRRELLAGRSPEDAAVLALDTSGRAVFVAGLTVCIALGDVRHRPDVPLRRLARRRRHRHAHDALVDHTPAGDARLLRPKGALEARPPGARGQRTDGWC